MNRLEAMKIKMEKRQKIIENPMPRIYRGRIGKEIVEVPYFSDNTTIQGDFGYGFSVGFAKAKGLPMKNFHFRFPKK